MDFYFFFDRCVEPLPQIQIGFMLKTSVSYQGSWLLPPFSSPWVKIALEEGKGSFSFSVYTYMKYDLEGSITIYPYYP